MGLSPGPRNFHGIPCAGVGPPPSTPSITFIQSASSAGKMAACCGVISRGSPWKRRVGGSLSTGVLGVAVAAWRKGVRVSAGPPSAPCGSQAGGSRAQGRLLPSLLCSAGRCQSQHCPPPSRLLHVTRRPAHRALQSRPWGCSLLQQVEAAAAASRVLWAQPQHLEPVHRLLPE